MFKVKSFMIPIAEYPKVYDTDTLRDAIKVLRDYSSKYGKEHRSVLVFSKTKKIDSEEELVGIMTIHDVLDTLKKSIECKEYIDFFTMSWPLFYKKVLLSDCASVKVSEMLRPLIKASINPNEDLTQAIEIMMHKRISILPVYEGNKVVGVVRALDLLDDIAKFL